MFHIAMLWDQILMFFPLIIAVRILSVFRLKRKDLKTTLWHEMGVILLFVYFIALVHITVDYARLFRFDFALSEQSNWIPFAGIWDILRSGNAGYVERNLVGNIMLFVPFGLLLPLLWTRWTLGRTVLAGAVLSFFIEMVQLFTGRGTDVDDLILNTLGTLCGYGLYRVLRGVLPRMTERFWVVVR